MTKKEHLATITILVKDRQANVKGVNRLLTQNGHLIMARLGVNIEPQCFKHCTGMITISLRGTIGEIKNLVKKLDSFYGIVAKVNIMTN